MITQPNSKVISENMYKDGKDNKGNTVGVRSYLVDSQAWNHICKNIYNVKSGQSANDSTTWGNCKDNTTTKYQKVKGLWAKHGYQSGTGWKLSENYNFSYLPEKLKHSCTGL